MFDCEDDQNVKMWKTKKVIACLKVAKGKGGSMLSLIIPPKDQVSRVSKMLGVELGTAANIKSRTNRLSVLTAITSAQQRLKLYNKIPPNGLVIFCGTILTDDNKDKKLYIDFEPFKPINTSMYMCDKKFHTEALCSLFSEEDKFAFVIMDGNGTFFGILQGNTQQVRYKMYVELPKKHGRGGQSASRFSRLRVEKRQLYIRQVCEAAHQFLLTDNKPNVSGIVLAGCADFKNELAQSAHLDLRLKEKIVKVIDVSYGGMIGFHQAIKLTADSFQNVKFVQEKKLIENFFNEISQDSGKYCFGIEDTICALEQGSVETIICWEELDIQRYVMKPHYSSSAAAAADVAPEQVILHLTPEKAKDRSQFSDTLGNEMDLVETQSFLEWLANNYKSFGSTLIIVSDKSPEGAQFVRGFGGLGCLLRYKSDFQYLQMDDENIEEQYDFADYD